jgi:hypothetical protein
MQQLSVKHLQNMLERTYHIINSKKDLPLKEIQNISPYCEKPLIKRAEMLANRCLVILKHYDKRYYHTKKM